jgi:hypothetical protein
MDRQLLLLGAEVTYGLAPAFTTAMTILAEGVDIKFTDSRDKPDFSKPGVGPSADHTYGQYVTVTFDVPLAGSGVAGTAPKWGPALKACGWSETIVAATSVTYGLLSDPSIAGSVAFKWRDGNRRVHQVTGARGKVDFDLTAGKRPALKFTFKGIHNVVTKAAAVLAKTDADFTGWLDAKPVASGTTTFSIDGVDGLGLRALSFSASDNVVFVDVPEQNDIRLLGERAFTGQAKITNPLADVFNFESHWLAADVIDWVMVHGATAGNIVTITGNAQILSPTYARDNGDDVASCGFNLVPTGFDDDDDLAIALT